MIGMVIVGRYRLERLIGRGSFGCVYYGFDEQLKRAVAVKVIEADLGLADISRRIRREREAQAKLNHPHIATLHDCGEHDGAAYFVMEYVDGKALSQSVDGSPWPWSRVAPVASQVCEAMAHAHARGVVHRDLSLNNILLVGSGEAEVKIVDFGLSELCGGDETRSARSAVGTPAYMSPEQVVGGDVDGRADIWAFGVGLFRLTSGRFPFEAEHPTAMMHMISSMPHGAHAATVPVAVRRLIDGCLAKDRDARFQTFPDVRAAVEEIVKVEASTIAVGIESGSVGATTTRNPYLNRVMIRSSSEFFGREREIRKIYARLDSQHPQSISIVGERRIGKSSLLNYVYRRENRVRHMQHCESTIFVYMDLQSHAARDSQLFVQVLLGLLQSEVSAGSAAERPGNNLDELSSCVRKLQQGGRRLAILLDEFEVITSNPAFEPGFFSYLRALANNYKVAFVTTSHDELQLMCHNKDIADSPFFNIFSNLPLRPFERPEACELISRASRDAGLPLEAHAEPLLRLAGLFPLYLQIACSALFEHLAPDPAAQPDWARVERVFLEEVRPHFDYVLEKFDEQELLTLNCVAAGKAVPRKLEYVQENLLRRGYLAEDGGRIEIFADSFREFLQASSRAAGRGGGLFKRWFA